MYIGFYLYPADAKKSKAAKQLNPAVLSMIKEINRGEKNDISVEVYIFIYIRIYI
jgi:hypothetical protein